MQRLTVQRVRRTLHCISRDITTEFYELYTNFPRFYFGMDFTRQMLLWSYEVEINILYQGALTIILFLVIFADTAVKLGQRGQQDDMK